MTTKELTKHAALFPLTEAQIATLQADRKKLHIEIEALLKFDIEEIKPVYRGDELNQIVVRADRLYLTSEKLRKLADIVELVQDIENTLDNQGVDIEDVEDEE